MTAILYEIDTPSGGRHTYWQAKPKRDWLRLDEGARFVPVAAVLGEYRTLDGCDYIIMRKHEWPIARS